MLPKLLKLQTESQIVRTKPDINDILAHLKNSTAVVILDVSAGQSYAQIVEKKLFLRSYVEVEDTKIRVHTRFFHGINRHQQFTFSLTGQVLTALQGHDIWKEVGPLLKLKGLNHIGETAEDAARVKEEFGQRVRRHKKIAYKHTAVPCLWTFANKVITGRPWDSSNPIQRTISNVRIYDLNSAYAAAAYNKMPDFSKVRFNSEVQEGEIGFDTWSKQIALKHPGQQALAVFPLIDPPEEFREWIRKNYEIKRTTKDPFEKADAKAKLVFFVGYAEKVNLLYRAYIVNTVNEQIDAIRSKYPADVLLMNTDSVHATRDIPELDANLGDGLGQWKKEFHIKVHYSGLNYSTEDGTRVVHRGIKNEQVYKFNKETIQVEDI